MRAAGLRIPAEAMVENPFFNNPAFSPEQLSEPRELFPEIVRARAQQEIDQHLVQMREQAIQKLKGELVAHQAEMVAHGEAAQREHEARLARMQGERAQAERDHAEYLGRLRADAEAKAAARQGEFETQQQAHRAAMERARRDFEFAHRQGSYEHVPANAPHTPAPAAMPPPQAAAPTYKGKLGDPPGFAGNQILAKGSRSARVEDYVFEVEEYISLYGNVLQAHEITEFKLVKMLGKQLEGDAKDWYRHLVQNNPADRALHSVRAWLQAVQEKFVDPNHLLITRDRMNRLKQGTDKQGLARFILEFNECAAILGRSDEGQLKYEFTTKLLPKARELCFTWPDFQEKPLHAVQQMLGRAEIGRREAYYYEPFQYTRTYATPMELGSTSMAPYQGDQAELGSTWLDQAPRYPAGRSAGGGRRGGQSGGFREGRGGRGNAPRYATDEEKQALRDERYKKGVCYLCGKEGHVKKECPENPDKKGEPARPENA
jgi:hypothetical protein